jgi:hypothetical protein
VIRSLAGLFSSVIAYGFNPAGVLVTFGKFGQFGTEIKYLTLDLQKKYLIIVYTDENVIIISFRYLYGSILIRKSILNNILSNRTTYVILPIVTNIRLAANCRE